MKRITYFIIAILTAVLLPQTAVQAAEQETVTLTAEEGKAALEIEIPDSSEGISTLRLRVRIEGAVGSLDPDEPLKFEVGEDVQAELQETRYNAEKGYFTIYLSGAKRMTDKSLFTAGHLVPNIMDNTPGNITIYVAEDGLEYVDGTGQLNDKTDIQPSNIVLGINQSAGKPEENPGNSGNGATGEQEGGSNDGSAGETGGGISEGTEKPATDGSESDSNSGSGADNGQNINNSTGEKITAAQTGDNTNPVLLCVLVILSACAVMTVLIIRRAGMSRKKSINRKFDK